MKKVLVTGCRKGHSPKWMKPSGKCGRRQFGMGLNCFPKACGSRRKK